MSTIFQILRIALTWLFAPLIPERYRPLWPWPDLVGMPGLQSTHAFICAVAGVVLWLWGQVVYQKQMAEMVTAIVASDNGTGDPGPITHYGLVTYFAFMFTPLGFLLTLFLLDGIGRASAGAMSGSVPGSLFLAIPLFLLRSATKGAREVVLTSRYGKASEPDRIVAEGDTLRVRRTRPHPEWNAHLAFRDGEKLYRLFSFNDRAQADGRPCFEYVFKPWPEGETLRRVVNIREGIHTASRP